MGSSVNSCVPLHNASLFCGLLDGDVHVGVWPALPIDVILGNDVAADRVWAEYFPPAKSTPLLKDCKQEFFDVFTACAVTQAMIRAELDSAVQKEVCDLVGGKDLGGRKTYCHILCFSFRPRLKRVVAALVHVQCWLKA